jgi:hypothetical protein
LFGRDENRMVILGAGRSPAIAERLIYHNRDDPMFETLFEGLYDERPEQRQRRRRRSL